MLTVQTWASLALVLSRSIDDSLKKILITRREQLAEFQELSEIAKFVIVEPLDSVEALKCELGFSVFINPVDGCQFGPPEFAPGWEYASVYDHWYELVFILDDSGFAHVVLVPDKDGVDAQLLSLCRQFAA